MPINAKVKRGIETKKGGDPNSEDKNNNTTGTAVAHVGDATTPEDSAASSRGASIDAHIVEAREQLSRSTRSIEDLFGAHPIDDDIWGETNPCDVSIDSANRKNHDR